MRMTIGLTELLEKNSDKREQRLQRFNLTLDAIKVQELQCAVPNLNLSQFFRDVIEAALHEEEVQGWIELHCKQSDDHKRELKEEARVRSGKA